MFIVFFFLQFLGVFCHFLIVFFLLFFLLSVAITTHLNLVRACVRQPIGFGSHILRLPFSLSLLLLVVFLPFLHMYFEYKTHNNITFFRCCWEMLPKKIVRFLVEWNQDSQRKINKWAKHGRKDPFDFEKTKKCPDDCTLSMLIVPFYPWSDIFKWSIWAEYWSLYNNNSRK